MKVNGAHITWMLLILLFAACESTDKGKEKSSLDYSDWATVEAVGDSSEVNMMMWQGDPLINDYMQDYVIPEVKERYHIDLEISPGQGSEIVSLIMSEQEVGVEESQLDLMWINGETFYQLRQLNALYGPFTHFLPNDSLVDWENPFIAEDFQQEVGGMECPWGNVQLAFIYDSARVESPPKSFSKIEDYVKAHPGKFTIPTEFTGMTILKSWLISIASEKELSGEFDPKAYEKYSKILWERINGMKQYFWKQGKTFPGELSQLHQLFANGEVDFTFSNNDSEADNKIIQGLFPASAKAYVPAPGTIQNSHYLGIPENSSNKPAAMLVANFMISPEAQFEKAQPEVWGDGTVLDVDRLKPEWKEKFGKIPSRRHGPSRKEIDANAYQEIAPEYMIRLYEDFRKYVIDAE